MKNRRPLTLSICTLSLFIAVSVHANDQITDLDTITVEANKAPVPVGEIAGTVTVINREDLEEQLATDIAQAVRYEPGIAVGFQGSRFGRSGFNVRGLDGNRVAIEVDGVEIPQGFAIGSFSNASRDFVDLNAVKQIEIIRGPASSLFGSDALGGVVSFVTMDPRDYLADDRAWALDGSVGYDSADESWHGAAGVAGDAAIGDYLLRVNRRERDALANDNADPFDERSDSVLAKAVFGQTGAGALRATVDYLDVDSRTEVDSLEGVQDFSQAFGFPFVITTTDVLADDGRERLRVSLDQEWRGDHAGPFAYARWRVYNQASETTQRTFESRSSFIAGASTSEARDRTFLYEQDTWGLEATFMHEFATGALQHRLIWGIEYENDETAQLRDGTSRDLSTGEITNVVGPDVFPVRDFPLSETDSYAVYLQDDISLTDQFRIIPALRYDRFDLSGIQDPIFAADNPGVPVSDLDNDEVSPRLGVIWDAPTTSTLQIFAQYAEGFRAPPVDDVNVGFTNFQFGYTAIPNADLKSESSRGFELGTRFDNNRFRFELTGFYSQYDDFIESFSVVDFDPINQLLVFQSINIDEVTIKGAEAKLSYRVNDDLRLFANAAYTHGDNDTDDVPLNSVEPLNGVAGAAYTFGNFGLTGIVTAARRQYRVDESTGDLFVPGGYATTDVIGFWQATEQVRLRAGVFNLSDRDFYSWNDVRGFGSENAASRLQAPGRTASIFIDFTL